MSTPYDIIEFEEEQGDEMRPTTGGIVGAILGALLGYKFAKQTYQTPEPQPLPQTFVVQNGQGTDQIELWLTTGAFAAFGYWLGSMFTGRRQPRRFRLRHRD